LREHNKRLETENKALRGTLLDQSFKYLGIDHSKGIGKTMRENYQGEASDEAIRKWATENYEYKFSEPQQQPTPGQQLGEHIASQQQGIEEGTSGSTSANPKSLQDQIAEAEAAGNWTQALNLKSQLLMDQASRAQGVPSQ
jgi:hypothetical protein